MIEALYLSDKQVRQKLLARVSEEKRVLLVAALAHQEDLASLGGREPFASIEEVAGEHVVQLLVIDDGRPSGMWRDPLGDLAAKLFPDERSRAYAAATGYLLLSNGQVANVLKKSGSAHDDAWFLQEGLARIHRRIPAPNPSEKPGRKKPTRERRAQGARSFQDLKAQVSSDRTDPWALLGLARECTLGQARRAFRALLAQYHPDKVAHLGPEFRELAEIKTRQIMDAWEKVQRALGGS